VEGLSSHPSRPHWQPGAGGLCLHSIVLDPTNSDRMWVGISAVGTFRSDDGGKKRFPTSATRTRLLFALCLFERVVDRDWKCRMREFREPLHGSLHSIQEEGLCLRCSAVAMRCRD